jgi:hypothetical protein
VQSVAAIGNKLQWDEQTIPGGRELRPEAGGLRGFGLPEFDPGTQENLEKTKLQTRCRAGTMRFGAIPKMGS